MDFWRAVEILNKRKWFMVLSAVLAVVLTYGASRLVGGKWQSTIQFAAVAPEDALGQQGGQSGAPLGGEAAVEQAKEQAVVYDTIVKSRDVLEPALRQAHMTEVPTDLPSVIQLTATAPKLYELQVTDSSMSRSRDLTNALADNFLKVYSKLRTTDARRTVKLLSNQLADADHHLKATRLKYDNYMVKHNLAGSLTVEVQTALTRVGQTREQLAEAQEQLAASRARLLGVQSQIAATPATLDPSAAGPDPALKPLQDAVTKAQKNLEAMQARYTSAMPQVRDAQQQLAQAQAQLQAEQNRPATETAQPNPALALLKTQQTALQQEVAGDQALIGTLTAGLAAAQKNLSQYNTLDGPFTDLATDVAAQQERRDNLADRLRNSRSLLDVTSSQSPLSIMGHVDDYNPPINLTLHRTMKLLLAALICSLLATGAIILTLENLDRRLRSVQQAEIALPAPVLAAIPQPAGEVNYANMARVTALFPQSLQSEAFRFLGLHLLNQRGTRSVMALSAKAEQGATTTLTNLGISLAQAGKRVVLVDANVRTPELHEAFGLSNEFGFTDVLQKPTVASVKRALRETDVPGLSVITSGQQPRNPWELFRSESLQVVSRQLQDQADFVLYDTPSSVLFTDALNLAPVVDGAFLCVRALEPLTGAEERLVQMLAEAGVPVLGCVLSDVPAAVVDGYGNYEHYYRPQANLLAAGEAEGGATIDVG